MESANILTPLAPAYRYSAFRPERPEYENISTLIDAREKLNQIHTETTTAVATSK